MLKVALIQLCVKSSKVENVQSALSFVKKAAKDGAKLICLPECFNSLYGVKHFGNYAENIPDGETCSKLAGIAKETKTWLIGGSIPESRDGKLFNTSVVFDPDGKLIGKYSKLHLFDIEIPGKITFKESEVLTGGNKLFSFGIPLNSNRTINIGIGICYDVRFPELAHIYTRDRNCSILFYPGAFNMTTGPAHWELLARARALDNQCYVALCSIARDPDGEYVGYGHSLVAGPWGSVISSLDHQEGVLMFDVNIEEMEAIRQQIPVSKQRRLDVYSVGKEKGM